MDDVTKRVDELIKKQKTAEAIRLAKAEIKRFGAGTKPRSLRGAKRKKLLRLHQLLGLAYAKLGDLKRAQHVLGDLVEQGFEDTETLGIHARTCMDLYDRTGKREDLIASRDAYARAFEVAPKGYYVGLNAAAKSILLGEKSKAVGYFEQVGRIIGTRVRKNDYWLSASVAEVQLMRAGCTEHKDTSAQSRAYAKAADLYRRATDTDPEALGWHGSTWLQASRLMRALDTPEEDQNKVWIAFRHLSDDPPDPAIWEPAYRSLHAYAFDPNLARRIETAQINELTLKVAWEQNLKPGPIGEYLEVIDYDPASDSFYEPVDLNDHRLVANGGLSPSEGEPQFHQQMVYGVAMNVIGHFERALGRRVLWSTRLIRDERGRVTGEEYVQRLRIYPHALREANAYYSPSKKALLFGYFPAETEDPLLMPGGTVFTCLSHDIIAHELSHAVLDGMHPRFTESTNLDVWAFHEALADIVALFQHFSHPEVLRHEIARTRGDLTKDGPLGQLAQEFGRAIGRRGALRDAIGMRDQKGNWKLRAPNPGALAKAREPHDRGAILVAALFDAFLTIYTTRTQDLIRIATQGSGVLRPGAIHPDLVDRLAREAAKSATHILHICIRALDYCPPVDITFGDYLRALITADVDAVPDDRYNYRLALIAAFRRRGIYPGDVRNLSVESLVWRPPRIQDGIDMSSLFGDDGRSGAVKPEWRPLDDRKKLWERMQANAVAVHQWLMNRCAAPVANEFGLTLASDAPRSLYFKRGRPTAEIHSVRLARRITAGGTSVTDLIVEILQRRRGYLDPTDQRKADLGQPVARAPDFKMRGGCTLLINPETTEVRYAVTKHILSGARLAAHRNYFSGSTADSDAASLRATYFGGTDDTRGAREPFAVLHGQDEY